MRYLKLIKEYRKYGRLEYRISQGISNLLGGSFDPHFDTIHNAKGSTCCLHNMTER